jgi:hypothetical protein
MFLLEEVMMERKIFVLVLALLASGLATAAVVDNFDSYSTGLVNTVANPPWTEAHNQGSSAATIGTEGGNQYLITEVTPLVDETSATWRGVTAIPNADTATTLFLRFRAETALQNSSFGLTDMATPVGYQNGAFTEYANQMRVSVQAGLLGFDVRNGTGFTSTRYAINVGEWYNVWAVLNNSTDKYDVYMNQGSAGATEADLKYSVMGFRKTSTNPLVTFMAMTQGSATGATNYPLDLDDISLTTGKDLSIPEPVTMVLLGLGGLMLRNRKR